LPLLANIMLDPLDKELERRGLRFARYADDFLILVKSLRAAQRVMQSITRFVEVRLHLWSTARRAKPRPYRPARSSVSKYAVEESYGPRRR